jgi:hypothetical protein
VAGQAAGCRARRGCGRGLGALCSPVSCSAWHAAHGQQCTRKTCSKHQLGQSCAHNRTEASGRCRDRAGPQLTRPTRRIPEGASRNSACFLKMLAPCLRTNVKVQHLRLARSSAAVSSGLEICISGPGVTGTHTQERSQDGGQQGGKETLPTDLAAWGPLRGSMPVCLALCRQIHAHPPYMAGASSLQPADHCRRRWVAACSSLLARCQHTQGGEPRCGPQQSRPAR